jgi:hypothetical protein
MKRRHTMRGVEEYAMSHRPPDTESGAPLHDLNANAVYPDDVYSKPHWYSGGEENFHEAWRHVSAAHHKPESSTVVRSEDEHAAPRRLGDDRGEVCTGSRPARNGPLEGHVREVGASEGAVHPYRGGLVVRVGIQLRGQTV